MTNLNTHTCLSMVYKVEPRVKNVTYYLPTGKFAKIHKIWLENSVCVNITNRIKKATFISCDLHLEEVTDMTIKVLGGSEYLPFFFTESGFNISDARYQTHAIDIEFDDYIDFGNYINDFEDVPKLCVTGQGEWPKDVSESFDKVYEKTVVKNVIDINGSLGIYEIPCTILHLEPKYTDCEMPSDIKCILEDGSRIDYKDGIENVVKLEYTGTTLLALLQTKIVLRYSGGAIGAVCRTSF